MNTYLSVILHLVIVRCEHPILKGTSYGYVPDDSKIIRYTEEKHQGNHSARTSRYYHDPPSQDYLPPFNDETTTMMTSSDEGYAYNTPISPFSDEVPTTIPSPSYLPTIAKTNELSPLHLEVNEMTCYNTQNDGRFQAILTFKSHNENPPVFEDTIGKRLCDIRSDSSPPRFNGRLYLNITKADFINCGVTDCSVGSSGSHLCLRLRFPSMPRMRLPEDPILTLQCKTRDRIASHTKHLLIDVGSLPVARSGGAVAKGGGRGVLRSKALLYRRGTRGDYTEALASHAKVSLGDSLMLKANVEPGNGWMGSRLSSVIMKGTTESGIILVDQNGCRSPKASAVCPRDPVSISPLTHTLLIRAAMFEGMKTGEEVRLSVRVIACLEPEDCRQVSCNSSSSRPRRDILEKPVPDPQTADSTSVLSFQVVIPQTEDFQQKGNGVIVAMVLLLSITIISSAALVFLKTKGQIGFEGHTI